MPTLAKILGLVLIVLGPTSLGAQAYRQPRSADRADAPRWSADGTARRPVSQYTAPQYTAPQYTAPASRPGEVVPAAYQSPPLPDRNRPQDAATERVQPRTAKPDRAAVPLSPPQRGRSVPLEPSSERSSPGAQNSRADRLPSLLYTGGSIVLVLGLFFIVAWAMRRAAPRGSILLPGEVVELLGQAPLASRQRVHLLRLGNKLLLVSVTTNGTETLGEITDPEEVDRLAGLC